MSARVPLTQITRRILLLRGQKVMLSSDLAELYGVETRALLQAVKRNLDRFPSDFMFQLTWDEAARLHSTSHKRISRSQIVILKRGQNPKYLPYAFTEQGVAMLSSVLRSQRAVHVNIEIMRAFVQLRRMLLTHRELSEKLAALEKKYDTQFKVVFDAIRELMNPPIHKRRTIGFAQP
jgi:ORF6N domain-containing protein